MSTVCFLDNDALLKLVACDLFWEAISTLGLTQADLRILPTAKYYFRKSQKVRSKYSPKICDLVLKIVEGCPVINPSIDEELEQLQIEGIDPGEEVLIAATKTESSFYLVTGDKRCLKVLASASELMAIRRRLKGRVICLEQLILKLIIAEGFETVLVKVLPAREYDIALKSIFGSGEKATQANVEIALKAYIDDLKKATQGLLKPDW